MATTQPNQQPSESLRIAVYSDDRTVRQQVHLALGHKVASDLPEITMTDFATPTALFHAFEHEDFDLAVLDAEAVPLGGMGIARQLKDEYKRPVPVVLLVARTADAWLAAWSNAEAISPYPIDPVRLPQTVAQVLRAARAHATADLEMRPEPNPAPALSSRHINERDDAEPI
jgi:DNA-binding response OmpR family regulator